jgi:hypothetical protein
MIVLSLAVGALSACVPPSGGTPRVRHPNPFFCQKLQNGSIRASQGAEMYCFGPSAAGMVAAPQVNPAAPLAGGNVAASNLAEDVAPNGTRGYGQSETSVAVNGSYVVEAWNDATAFFSPCGSPQYKEEVEGFAFSSNGGRTFHDMGGLPNNDCNNNFYVSDPSVATATIGGTAYFYVAGMYDSVSGAGPSFIAMSVCTATGTGTSANLACSQPVRIAQSSECGTMFGQQFCSFLDKDFLAVDPVRQRLYVSFTEFGSISLTNQIELGVCDISNPTVPVCFNAGYGSAPEPPYLVVAPTSPNLCENEGAYPAVDPANGDVYVAYEHNIETSLTSGGPCAVDPVRNVVTRIPYANLTLPFASGGSAKSVAVNVTSMSSAFVPGYNRFPPQDFPRIAVSRPFNTVSIVWNDSRFHPLGDILMQSYALGTLTAAAGPVRLNASVGGLHFLPALRNADSSGRLDVSWYERAQAATTLTSVAAATSVAPTATTPPSTSVTVTNVPTDWNAVSSDIVPNFGDYTDNYVLPGGSPHTVAVAWADGRAGTPQAFFTTVTGT